VPYQLRHTAASLLLDNGATIEEVADVLGDNPTTVYRHYRHRLRASAAAAVAPMERLFGVVG
jgi:integrase